MSDSGQSAHTTNRKIENAAIDFVLAFESAQGRPARDTRGRGAAGDVAGEVRTIEVKAYGTWARGQDLWLEARQVEEAAQNANFWVYVVENLRQGDPSRFRLLQIGGEELHFLLARATEHRYFTVAWPVAAYDNLVRNQHPTASPARPSRHRDH